MAAESRTGDSAVVERYTLERMLAEEPYLFDFFQAVRMVERFMRDRQPVGRFANPQTEVVRFGVHDSVSFPASEIQSFEWREGKPPLMRVNFLGLTGPQGALPLYYSLLVRDRIKARDTAMRDFFDIFNHRILSLFYQAWEKYRFTVEYERSGRDQFSHHLLDLIGLGTSGLESRQKVPDYSLMYYAGLLGQQPRSAAGLRQVLADYFEVPVEIEQFAGAWYRLTPDLQTNLEEDRDPSEQLALGAVVGDEIWDEQSRVRIKLGPLTLRQYLDFLPIGSAYEPLKALARFYAGDQLDFEVQLIMKRNETPICELGREDEAAPLLGWVSWSKTVPMGRDPGDAVLEIL
jgi:type VI secretion system protein ImpH